LVGNSKNLISPKESKMMHVLLVEDDKDFSYMLNCLLQKEGYTVTISGNGYDAIKEFHKKVPDLVLLDLMLPMIDGMEICWRIRAFSNVPIIIISAKNAELDVYWGLEAGANAYLTKPFDLDELLQRIKSFTELSSKQVSRSHDYLG
jgi:two-component system, OmpR family, response regulator VicR